MTSPPRLIFKLGDKVRIKAGPFAAITGKIEGINQAKSMLKVVVDIFGRITAVKISFRDAEKVHVGPPEPPGAAGH